MKTYLHHRTIHAPRRELNGEELARVCLHQCHDDVAEAMMLQSRIKTLPAGADNGIDLQRGYYIYRDED